MNATQNNPLRVRWIGDDSIMIEASGKTYTYHDSSPYINRKIEKLIARGNRREVWKLLRGLAARNVNVEFCE